MYLAGSLLFIAIPLHLGSVFGLIIGLPLVFLLIAGIRG
jgi:hypothetical protein